MPDGAAPITLSQQVALSATLRMRDDILRAARAVPADRLLWRPGGVAQHTIGILAHCAATNLFFASAFAGTPLPYRAEDERREAENSCDTLEKAEAFINQSVTAICDAIVAIPTARLTETMIMPWGERIPVALGILAPSYHMQYHEGQIGYIQSILGDDGYY